MHRVRLLREFLTLGTLGTVAAVVGIGSGLYSMYETHQNSGRGGGGGGGGMPGAMTYVPEWQHGADQSWQALMQNWASTMGTDQSTLLPFLRSAFGAGADRLPWMTRNMDEMGSQMWDIAGTFRQGAANLYDAGSRTYETALDPRNALHDRTQHQVVEGMRAADSARGLAMSPESAGLEGQAISNFNIDWENQQLQRQLSGLQGMAGAYDSAGRQQQAGVASMAGAADMWGQATKLPFDLSQLYSGAMSSGIYNPMNALMGNLGQYMGLGQSGSQAAFGQGQTNLNNITSGLMELGKSPWLQNYFNGGGWNNSYFGSTAGESTGSGASSWVDSTGWGGA